MWQEPLASVQRRGVDLPTQCLTSTYFQTSYLLLFMPFYVEKVFDFSAPLLLVKNAFLNVMFDSTLNSELWL